MFRVQNSAKKNWGEAPVFWGFWGVLEYPLALDFWLSHFLNFFPMLRNNSYRFAVFFRHVDPSSGRVFWDGNWRKTKCSSATSSLYCATIYSCTHIVCYCCINDVIVGRKSSFRASGAKAYIDSSLLIFGCHISMYALGDLWTCWHVDVAALPLVRSWI